MAHWLLAHHSLPVCALGSGSIFRFCNRSQDSKYVFVMVKLLAFLCFFYLRGRVVSEEVFQS